MTPGEAGFAGNWDVESLLADALRPIEPPDRLSTRLEEGLSAVTSAAATELSDWAEELEESELRALRDPRNWVRPVLAVSAGSAASVVVSSIGDAGLRERSRYRLAARLWAMRISHGRSGRPCDSRCARSKWR